MDLNKIHSAAQPLLKRTDVTYRLVYEGATPSRHQLVEALGKKEKGLIVIRHVYPHAGEQSAMVQAHVYSDEKTAASLEQAKMLAKQRPAPKAAEAATEA